MNPLSDNPLSILSFIVAPALLTNASSLILLGTGNRFARAIDRARNVAGELSRMTSQDDPLYAMKFEQWQYAERRTLHLVRALTAFYLAIGCFAGASLLALLGAVFHVLHRDLLREFSLLTALACGAGGVGGLVSGAALLVLETRMAHYILKRETKITMQVTQRPAPANSAAPNADAASTR